VNVKILVEIELPESLGARISLFRRIKGMGQKDLAAKVGVDFTYISKLESNERTPSLETLRKIAAALGQQAATFLATEGQP
jgi:transcriptional regulator with XRE-family HTH domain